MFASSLRVCAFAAVLAHTLWAQDGSAWNGKPITCYEVPAMSSIMRLPDTLPADAKLSSQLRLIAAQGEYEPASFVVAPNQDIAKFELRASALRGANGSIPVTNIDIKIVKCWYQAGTSWYSYFGDSDRRELVPELLLNDENLVKVDMEKKENYLRIGKEYTWISYPKEKATKPFNYLAEPVADSTKLLPVKLAKGQNKQFWVTVKVPQKAAAGLYQGKVSLIADGKDVGAMTLQVKILPFELPAPRTYYNLDNEFLVTLYGTDCLNAGNFFGLDKKKIDTLQLSIYKNLIAHNVRNPMLCVGYSPRKRNGAEVIRELRLMKKAGFSMKPLLSGNMVWLCPWLGDNGRKGFEKRIDELYEIYTKEVGHRDIYMSSWDEAGPKRVRTFRELAEYTTSKGIKIWMTSHKGRHYNMAGHVISYANHGGWPKQEYADKWHAIGAKVASYAGPHTGPENPDVFRRWEGMARYKARYDGSFNYEYFSGVNTSVFKNSKANLWNDFLGGAFRSMNLVYPTPNGVINTIAWEGFREGIDDIRYATKLKLLAAEAITNGNAQAAWTAKKALVWLELLDATKADLNAVRIEMIDHIMKIRKALGK